MMLAGASMKREREEDDNDKVSVKREREEDAKDEVMEDAEGSPKAAQSEAAAEGIKPTEASPAAPDLLAPQDGDCIVYVSTTPELISFVSPQPFPPANGDTSASVS